MGSPATQPGQIHRRLAREEVAGARESHAGGVEQGRRKDVLLLQAGHLLAQALPPPCSADSRKACSRRCRPRCRRRRGYLVRKVVVEARGAEILADVLQWMAERFGDAAAQFRAVLYRPEGQQRRTTAGTALARRERVIGNQRHIAQAQVLPVAFVVAEQKQLVFANGPARGRTEFVSLERRDRALVEEIARVQSAVAQKLIQPSRAVDWCRKRSRCSPGRPAACRIPRRRCRSPR